MQRKGDLFIKLLNSLKAGGLFSKEGGECDVLNVKYLGAPYQAQF